MPSLRAIAAGLLFAVLFAVTSVVHAAPTTQDIYLPAIKGAATMPPDGGPLNVEPRHDVDRAMAVTVPLVGGEVVAIADNGTRFTLTIPDGALAVTTTVVLTPLASIGGLPQVDLVGAVEIGPLNLWLLEAAMLKIEPAQPLPVAQEYPFAYYGDGQDFHPYPIVPYATELLFPIGKFDGGYGMARGATARASQATAPAFTPIGREALLRSQVAEMIQAERRRID